MKKLITVVAVGLSGLALLADSCAFTYQACLRDEKGEVIKESGNVKQNHVVEIRLYDTATGGTPLWGRAYSVLTDEKGLFNVAVSDEAGSPLVSGNSLATVLANTHPAGLFLGLKVQGSSGEIVPRQAIYAAPFAAVANDVRAVSGDLTIGGTLTFTDGSNKVTISKDGITQDGKGGTMTARDLTVTGTATVGGMLKAGDGVLIADGTGVTVKDHPLNLQDTELQINGNAAVFVPVGGIIMWTKPDLPDGTHWAVCDGENGTPDLRGRFVVGVDLRDDEYNTAKKTGGAKKVTLTTGNLPPHRHTYRAYANDSDGPWKNLSNYEGHLRYSDGSSTFNDYTLRTGDTTHNGDNKTDAKPIESAAAFDVRPPYFSLYYIMRIK